MCLKGSPGICNLRIQSSWRPAVSLTRVHRTQGVYMNSTLFQCHSDPFLTLLWWSLVNCCHCLHHLSHVIPVDHWTCSSCWISIREGSVSYSTCPATSTTKTQTLAVQLLVENSGVFLLPSIESTFDFPVTHFSYLSPNMSGSLHSMGSIVFLPAFFLFHCLPPYISFYYINEIFKLALYFHVNPNNNTYNLKLVWVDWDDE